MFKLSVAIFMMLFIPQTVFAEMTTEKQNGAILVKSATTKEVEDLFLKYGYEDYTKTRSYFPRIYLSKLPTDWKEIPESPTRNRTFIRILLPLVLKINEEIKAEREEVEKVGRKYVNGQPLSEEDLKLLEEKAEKYNVFTRLKGDERTGLLLKRLLTNIDELPPSIMISTAAIYTDWGTSRLALEANDLYKEEIWYKNEGLRPADDENSDYRYVIYANLEDCIRAKSLKINSHVNYDYFRESRRMSRELNRPPFGRQLAVKMMNDSNYQNIAGIIDYTFIFYKLDNTDYFPQLRDVE